jgi:hypothetical protein
MASILKIVENEKHTLGRELWLETGKNVKNEKYTLRSWNMVTNPLY